MVHYFDSDINNLADNNSLQVFIEELDVLIREFGDDQIPQCVPQKKLFLTKLWRSLYYLESEQQQRLRKKDVVAGKKCINGQKPQKRECKTFHDITYHDSRNRPSKL